MCQLGWSHAEAMTLLATLPLPVEQMSGIICCHSSCREIEFEIFPRNVPEPRWLQQARSEFNATLASAADARRRALLMCLHPRCSARDQS